MADDHHHHHHHQFNSGTHWWDRSRFDTAAGGSSSSSTTSSGLTSLGGFPWAPEMGEVKERSSMESASVSDSSTVELHMMGLGLSSQAMDWNQSLLRSDHHKGENSFRSLLQENLNSSTSYQQPEPGIGSPHQIHWRDHQHHHQMSRVFSLDQPQFSPHGSSSDSTVTCQGLQPSFQIDSPAAMYGGSTVVFQGLLASENQNSTYENRATPMSTGTYPYGGSYGGGLGASDQPQQLLPAASWSNSKVPQFFRSSPPKQNPPPQSQLHFSNNAPFWNASAPSSTTISDVRPSFFPSLQPQFPASSFEEKPKNISEVRDSSTAAKKSGSETSTKRPRNETASPMPPFKARKEKMGDRITALQQLVSPFGKTDTASVLSEAIEYIKFLHDQVTVLSTPYMKSGAPIHHLQSSDKSKDPEGQRQDLRSRGLCLVPVSSTYPVTETTVDFWNPTFGGTFR